MAAPSRPLRRGLPRVPGGEPWPPAGEAPARVAAVVSEPVAAAQPPVVSGLTAAPGPSVASAPSVDAAASVVPAPSMHDGGARQLRRGLPRVPGGEPWPPAATAPLHAAPAARTAAEAVAAPAPADVPEPVTLQSAAPATVTPKAEAAPAPATGSVQLRRGLPRVPGGEPWPPAGAAPVHAAEPSAPVQAAATVSAPVTPEPAAAIAPSVAAPEPAAAPAAPPAAAPARPTPAKEPVTPVPAATERTAAPKPEARLYGSRTLAGWIRSVALLAVGAVVAAGILILAARGVTTLPGVPAFLKQYPGSYALPDVAQSGFPWWAQWQHFLNFFLMVLIIRSGYQVRTQQKPPAYWTPNRDGKKISITLWLHQSLDVLWLANGLIFAVLLFASGHWLRIVPTSWDVFPNAASALLQYMTLDWPVEDGWVNYNSLQQLMYFIVVFIAAPLAAITGARMSELWPKNATTLNRIYPVEAARALHFPTMLFFVLFILVHVFLVFATGALRNLNHMFAGTDEVNWVGFWLFAAAIAVTAAGWFAARPLVLAPLARLSGKVSSR